MVRCAQPHGEWVASACGTYHPTLPPDPHEYKMHQWAVRTDMAPADSPMIVTRFLSPLKFSMLACTHCSASRWSRRPKFPTPPVQIVSVVAHFPLGGALRKINRTCVARYGMDTLQACATCARNPRTPKRYCTATTTVSWFAAMRELSVMPFWNLSANESTRAR